MIVCCGNAIRYSFVSFPIYWAMKLQWGTLNADKLLQNCQVHFVNDTTITLLRLQAAVMAICSLFRLSAVSKR